MPSRIATIQLDEIKKEVDLEAIPKHDRYKLLDILGIRQEADELLDRLTAGMPRFKPLGYSETRRLCPRRRLCTAACKFEIASQITELPEFFRAAAEGCRLSAKIHKATVTCERQSASTLTRKSLVVAVTVKGFELVRFCQWPNEPEAQNKS